MELVNYNEDGSIQVNADFIKYMMEHASNDQNSENETLKLECKRGQELAQSYRKAFPNVSDHDLGAFMLLASVMLADLSDAPALYASYSARSVANQMLHSAVELLKTEIELGSI